MPEPDFELLAIFEEINTTHFDCGLISPCSGGIRGSNGSWAFYPRSKKMVDRIFKRNFFTAVFAYADFATSPHHRNCGVSKDEKDGEKHIRDTLGHEMIHYWLWYNGKPYGHTEEFYKKMNEMGVSRYNPIPKRRPYRYIYQCPKCEKEIPTRKRLRGVACKKCCEDFAGGKFSHEFKLKLLKEAQG